MASPNNNKVVLITGATGGIGKATAFAFAKEGGYDLALHYNSANEETRSQITNQIHEHSGNSNTNLAFFQADLSDYDQIRNLHTRVTTTFGKISVLFNNAGGTAGHNPVHDLTTIPIDAFEKTWRLNTASGILLAQLCLPHMQAQGWGRIIFDSSVAAFTGGVVGPHYASSKSAIHGFVHWLAGNVAGKGVTVNAVAPALIGGTNMVDDSDEGVRERIASKVPVGRLGRPEEVAETVMWMVRTGYVTNKVIGVDGGYYPY